MFGRLHLLFAAVCISSGFGEGHALCANATIGHHSDDLFVFKEEVPSRVVKDWDGEEVKLDLVFRPCFLAGAEAEVCVHGPNKPDVKFKEDDLDDIKNMYNILVVHVDERSSGHQMPLYIKGTVYSFTLRCCSHRRDL